MDVDTAIKGVMSIRERLHENNLWSNPGALSEAALKLATYNSYLADNLSVVHKEATDKAYAVFTEARQAGEAQGTAEQMARGESTEQREHYEKVKNIYTATDKLIIQIDVRIKTVEAQMKREQ